ncbi:MAG: transposase [Desulfomonile sp.]|nr:transposase [Desulfomonile sp.]
MGRGIRGCNLHPGKKRGAAVGPTKRGKGTKCMVVVAGKGIPPGSHTDPAAPAEIKLLERVPADIKVAKKGSGRPRTRPKRMIGDKAYDSDPHRKMLRKRGISLLSPHRKNHRNVNRQDDRFWDRSRRRYIVERTFAWLGGFRRLVVRYEHHISMFVAFLGLAFAMVTLRKCL